MILNAETTCSLLNSTSSLGLALRLALMWFSLEYDATVEPSVRQSTYKIRTPSFFVPASRCSRWDQLRRTAGRLRGSPLSRGLQAKTGMYRLAFDGSRVENVKYRGCQSGRCMAGGEWDIHIMCGCLSQSTISYLFGEGRRQTTTRGEGMEDVTARSKRGAMRRNPTDVIITKQKRLA